MSFSFKNRCSRRLVQSLILPLCILPLAGRENGLAAGAEPAARQIYVCTSSHATAALRQAVDEFTASAGGVPVLKALITGKEADGIAAHASEELMTVKAYNTAAHNHLVVVGLRSQDPLIDKVWGYDASIDEARKSVYAEGWGYLQGDIGWVESDRNPFLHSHRISSAPEDTILVKITGTSEAGVTAALKAFQGGMLNGFVVAGPLKRAKTTLLDLDPLPEACPRTLPAQMAIDGETAALAGWNQIPEQEYRAVLEAGGTQPKKMWRYKYLVPGMLEQKPMVRWLGGVSRMAFGNAVDVIECESPDAASAAARQLSKITCQTSQFAMERTHVTAQDLAFKPLVLSSANPAWECTQVPDEEIDTTWKIIVTSAGSYLFLSSLPPEGTSAVIASVVGQPPS